MINKLRGFLKGCSDEENKKGKAIADTSKSAATLGIYIIFFGVMMCIFFKYFQLDHELIDMMLSIIKCGIIFLYIALSVPFVLGHKNCYLILMGKIYDIDDSK